MTALTIFLLAVAVRDAGMRIARAIEAAVLAKNGITSGEATKKGGE